MSSHTFPALTDWQATKETLHKYSRVVGVVPRAHATPHPKWWHISLKVDAEGLVTDRMDLPGGSQFWLRLDLRRHKIVLDSAGGELREFDMTQGLSATALGDQLLAAVEELGLEAEYAREKFADDEPRRYDPATVENYLAAISLADQILKKHRERLPGEKSPVQLWPHGFDLAFEWFGTRIVEYEEHGEVEKYPAQLNFGFSPGEPSHPAPYFYSNPWPFEKDRLVERALPSGARWFTESWQGSILPYEKLVGDPQAEEKLLAYFQAVYEISRPTLIA